MIVFLDSPVYSAKTILEETTPLVVADILLERLLFITFLSSEEFSLSHEQQYIIDYQ